MSPLLFNSLLLGLFGAQLMVITSFDVTKGCYHKKGVLSVFVFLVSLTRRSVVFW